MESCSLHSSLLTTTTAPSLLPRSGLTEKPSLRGQLLKFHNTRKYPLPRNLKYLSIRAQASEAVEAVPKKVNPKDEDIAFVAGATGKVGSRTVRELLKLGFRVRAGVRSAQRAENLVQSVKQMKLDVEGVQPVEMLEIVECDLEKRDQIRGALGNASVVLCCIGASEKEVFDISGPYRIDFQATKNLIDAATVAKVEHFIMVSSLGTNKIGFPAAILNLFWGVLIWKRKAEEALIASGIPYTIVRPGGMERPTDAYKETHNLTLSLEDTLFGGQVSNLQVAELIAVMAKNRGLSYCKVVEVIAETTAPLTPMEELLKKIPSQRAPPKEPDVAKPDPAPSESVVSEAPSTPIEKDTPMEKEPPPTSDVEIQPAASDSTPSSTQINVSEPTSKTTEEEALQTEAKKTRPLSPYFVYDDLKPPTSPMPTAPSGQKENENIVDAVSTPSPADIETSTSETTTTETKSTPEEEQKTRPLSPYAAYEDLKPPTSPSPTPSGPKDMTLATTTPEDIVPPSTGGNDVAKSTSTDFVEKDAPPTMTYHLSPYHVYEDLKPPTSPSPTPSGPKDIPPTTSTPEDIVPPSTGGNDVAKSATTNFVEKVPPQNLTYHLSPYHVYDDLKPPSSPSPSAPTVSVLSTSAVDSGSQTATVSGNGTAQPPSTDKPSEKHNHTEIKLRPLSPFTMYEDLKPPTTPSPSPRKS